MAKSNQHGCVGQRRPEWGTTKEVSRAPVLSTGGIGGCLHLYSHLWLPGAPPGMERQKLRPATTKKYILSFFFLLGRFFSISPNNILKN